MAIGIVNTLLISSLFGRIANPIAPAENSTIYAALQYKVGDPSLYKRDIFLSEMYRTVPRLYPLILSHLVNLLGGLRIVYIIAPLAINSVLLVGVYFLSFYILQDKLCSFLAGIFCNVIKTSLGPFYWGCIPFGIFNPRDVTMMLSPLIFLWFLTTANKNKSLLIFIVLGVLVYFHPISSLHLCGVLLIASAFTKRRIQEIIKVCSLYAFAFIITSLPFVIGFFSKELGSKPPMDLIKWTIPFMFTKDWSAFGGFDTFFFPTILVGATGFFYKRKKNITINDKIMMYFFFSTLIMVLCSVIGEGTLRIAQFQFFRTSRYFYLFGYIYSAYLIRRCFSFKSIYIAFLGICLFFVVLIPNLALLRKGIRVVISGLTTIEAETGQEILEGTKVEVSRDWQSFYKLCNWSKHSTSKESLFLIPPRGFALFRVYAQRGVTFSWYDNVVMIYMSRHYAEEWYRRYQEITDAYNKKAKDLLLGIANKYQVDYIISFEEIAGMVDYLKYRNKMYSVYINPSKAT